MRPQLSWTASGSTAKTSRRREGLFRSRRTSARRTSSARPPSVCAACEVRVEHCRERREAVAGVGERRREAEIGEPAFALLGHQPGILEQAEVPRDAGLGDPEDRGELGDVKALGVEDAEQPEPLLVAKRRNSAGASCTSTNLHLWICDCKERGRGEGSGLWAAGPDCRAPSPGPQSRAPIPDPGSRQTSV
jgi:hypothetical protein